MKYAIHGALLGALICGTSFAADSHSTANPSADSTNAVNTAGVVKSVSGTVQSVDQEAQRIRIRDNQSGSVTELKVDSGTTVTRGDDQVSFLNVEAGDTVLVAYAPDKTADSIQISEN